MDSVTPKNDEFLFQRSMFATNYFILKIERIKFCNSIKPQIATLPINFDGVYLSDWWIKDIHPWARSPKMAGWPSNGHYLDSVTHTKISIIMLYLNIYTYFTSHLSF